MNIDDIFLQRRKRWNILINKRRNIKIKEYECPTCHKIATNEELRASRWICKGCDYYFPMSPKERLRLLVDEGSFKEMNGLLATRNPIDFPEYDKKLMANRKRTGQCDAFVSGVAKIDSVKVAIGVLDGRFLMGSMGTVVGEKIVRLVEYAEKKGLPLLIFSASGGARMQEGLFSLMQMAKTSAAIHRFKESGGLFISYLTNPTTGGVSASYASLGDIIIAEPDALICFAGPRVIKQTIGETLPEGFQHAEFLLEHGMIDMILERKDMKKTISKILMMHRK